MVKIQVASFGATFNLRCPRCGCDEFIPNAYDSRVHKYHHCITCGADMFAEDHMITMNTKCGLDIGLIIEKDFYLWPLNVEEIANKWVAVTSTTHTDLCNLCKPGQSFNDVIAYLLQEYSATHNVILDSSGRVKF